MKHPDAHAQRARRTFEALRLGMGDKITEFGTKDPKKLRVRGKYVSCADTPMARKFWESMEKGKRVEAI